MDKNTLLYSCSFQEKISYNEIWLQYFYYLINQGHDYEMASMQCDEFEQLIKDNEDIFNKGKLYLNPLLPDYNIIAQDVENAFKAYRFLQEKGKIK